MRAMTTTVAVLGMLGLTPAISSAQFTRNAPDLTGMWVGLGGFGGGGRQLPGDYLGLPINDEARARADAWIGAYKSMPERQCMMYTSHYVLVGPGALGITKDVDPLSGEVIAWRMTGTIDRLPRTIWMDGRPHPSEWARHTPAGFSTGEWIRNTLHVRTTHLTEGVLSINGVPTSSDATIDEYITRHGTGMLILTMVLDDPVYLDEPYIRTRVWALNAGQQIVPQPCEPVAEIAMPAGTVPHHLPGRNPDLEEAARRYQLPIEVVRGGAATTYPEYLQRLRTLPVPAPKR